MTSQEDDGIQIDNVNIHTSDFSKLIQINSTIFLC